MVTSHLLGEIERVCDFLIAIDAGKLHYAGPVVDVHRADRAPRLELDDDVPEFAARLRARGLDVEARRPRTARRTRDDATYDIVRDVAAELEAPLARMEVTRHRLEELFRETSRSRRWLSRAPRAAIYDLGYQR